MTAQEIVTGFLVERLGSNRAKKLMDQLLAEHAHKLAEAQRFEAENIRRNPFSREYPEELAGWDAAADMIDPEVED